MERTSTKRRHLHRKYKRYAAAMAGAAILTGAVLPGIPAARALAAESPTNAPPIQTEQTVQVKKHRIPVKHIMGERAGEHRHRGWHEHENSWPSPDDNQIRYEDGRVYYRSDSDRSRSEYVEYMSSPVDVVKERAGLYGFNPYGDAFTLLTMSSHKAVVEVRKQDTGKLFDVFLERDGDREWRIVEVRAL